MTDCLFCKLANGELPADLLYSDEIAVAVRDLNPRAETHLLVIPREHVTGLDALGPAQDAMVAHCMRLLSPLAREQGLDDGFRTVINTGPGGGQEIFHLHIHVLGGKDLPGF